MSAEQLHMAVYLKRAMKHQAPSKRGFSWRSENVFASVENK
jgi:hypothetical protein